MRYIALFLCLCIQVCIPVFANEPDSNYLNLENGWKFKKDNSSKDGIGLKNGWKNPDFDDSGWDKIQVGKSWESQGINYNGIAWYRNKILIPGHWNNSVLCFLGKPDDKGDVYFNGELIHSVKKYGPEFKFIIPPELIKKGEYNYIAIRISDYYKSGGLIGNKFSMELFRPFKKAITQKPAPGSINLSLTENLKNNVIEKGRWEYGWRDQGTSATMPRMSIVKNSFQGKDAVVMDVWYPNSTEFVDYTLKAEQSHLIEKKREEKEG